MKFGPVLVKNAEGAVLAHAVTTAAGRLKKGKTLSIDDIASLQNSAIETVIVARLEADDIDENEAARIIASALASKEIYAEEPFTGRVNLFAKDSGLLQVDRDTIDRINQVDAGITVATLPQMALVEAGRMVATVKIIPFAVSRHHVNRAGEVAAGSAALELRSFRPKRVGLIATELPSLKTATMDKTRKVLEQRLRRSGSDIVEEIRVEHSVDAVAAALGALCKKCDLVILFGASAIIDCEDVIPAGLRRAGGVVEHFGMPVDPGNLLMLGNIDDVPIIGAPGCARSSRENGFDWILQRLLADVLVTANDIKGMGVGGLLMEIHSRPQPRQPALAGGEVHGLVLAAGQSRRMGKQNKLLASIDGQPLVRRIVDAALNSQLSGVTVVSGHEAAKVEKALDGLEVSFAHNPDYASGLASSLRCGIEALPENCGGVLVLLADMPEITPQMIGEMLEVYNNAPETAIIQATSHGKRGNPVLWSSRYFEALKNISGDVGARHIIGENADQVVEVELGDAAALDIDTPLELQVFTGKNSES